MQDTDIGQEIMGGIPAPMLLLSQTGRVAKANTAAIKLFGAWILGRSYVSVLRQPELLKPIEEAFFDAKPGQGRYVQLEGEVETEYSVTISCMKSSELTGFVMLHFADVSPISHAANLRRGFVANVSHELKTPLTALTGFIETLQHSAKNDPAARDHFLTLMAREAARMNRLVSDLLSLSRVEAQERARPSERVDLVALMAMALEPMGAMADAAGRTLRKDLPKSADVQGDPDQLTQVIINLVENGIKYGGTTITLRLQFHPHDGQLRGPAWQMSVEDDGPGIDPLHLPRLTERFYRIDSHRSREKGGTGLGLAIVKHISNRHRGRLKIESDLGRGSVFSVFLPALTEKQHS